MAKNIIKKLFLLFPIIAVSFCLGLSSQASSADKIIVSGASGKLGHLVVEELINNYQIAPSNLILVSRSPDSLEAYQKLGASVRFGDFNQPDSLRTAYAGGDRMLLISIGFSATPRPELHKNAIDAAIAAGVTHIAYTSFVNADLNIDSALAVDHRATEETLRNSGVNWTMLRNNIYAQNLITSAIQAVRDGRLLTAKVDSKVAYVTREDCAAAAAAVLATPGHENKSYNITGPDLIGPRQIAALSSTYSGKRVELMAMEASELVDFLVNEGVSERDARRQAGPNAETGSIYLQQISNAVFELTGQPARRVTDMFAEQREEFIEAAQ